MIGGPVFYPILEDCRTTLSYDWGVLKEEFTQHMWGEGRWALSFGVNGVMHDRGTYVSNGTQYCSPISFFVCLTIEILSIETGVLRLMTLPFECATRVGGKSSFFFFFL